MLGPRCRFGPNACRRRAVVCGPAGLAAPLCPHRSVRSNGVSMQTGYTRRHLGLVQRAEARHAAATAQNSLADTLVDWSQSDSASSCTRHQEARAIFARAGWKFRPHRRRRSRSPARGWPGLIHVLERLETQTSGCSTVLGGTRYKREGRPGGVNCDFNRR